MTKTGDVTGNGYSFLKPGAFCECLVIVRQATSREFNSEYDQGRVVPSRRMMRDDLRAREPVVLVLVVLAAWEDGGSAVVQGMLSPLIPPSGTFSPSGEKDRRQDLCAIRKLGSCTTPRTLCPW